MAWGAALGGALGSFLGPIGTAVGAGLGGILESGVNTFGSQYFNKKNAKTAFNRTLYMSNSAHQREVADLRAAGLNPVLSAIGNGASSVAVPVSSSPQFGDSSFYGEAIEQANSAQAQRRQQKLLADLQMSNLAKDTDLKTSDIKLNNQRQMNETANTNANLKLLESQIKLNNQRQMNETALTIADKDLKAAQTEKYRADSWLELSKEKWFQALPDHKKHEVLLFMMYPEGVMGEAMKFKELLESLYNPAGVYHSSKFGDLDSQEIKLIYQGKGK